ncbi:MAG: tRNA lysidine(34) synthetase TilS [Chloroflexi bacterium]|nr:MAG: tRNA lysidine(34) synthetase TilS [Chloroflexota bacterium]
MDLRNKILRIIHKYALIPPHSTIIVGVSGGPDSLALLHVLYRLQQELSYKIIVATVDHRLRGDAGRADALFVRQLADEWDLPLVMDEIDVAQLADVYGMGVEEAGRVARYDFFARVAREHHAAIVAVAHHADDQAETILMRIIRGTGVTGLGGMAMCSPLPGHPELQLIRPFLQITRAEIMRYCADEALSPREDATNFDTTLVRNALRHEILPQLEQFNPTVRRALTQLADIMMLEDDFVSSRLNDVVKQHVDVIDGRVMIERVVFVGLHRALQRRFVMWGVQQVGAAHEAPRYERIIAAVDVALTGHVGAVVEFPNGVQLRLDYETVIIEHRDAPQPISGLLLPENFAAITVSVPGITHIPGTNWSLRLETSPSSDADAQLAIAAHAVLHLRSRRAGDRLAPPGLHGHTQKLKTWMINRKIRRVIRDRMPLLIANGEVAAILVDGEWVVTEPFVVREDREDSVFTIYLSTQMND